MSFFLGLDKFLGSIKNHWSMDSKISMKTSVADYLTTNFLVANHDLLLAK
jgi:hypothetical protein